MKDAANPPIHCSEERTHVLMECPFGHVLVLLHREGYSGQACCRLGFLDGANAIWLSWSAALSLHLFRLSWSRLSIKLCYWTTKQFSQKTFLEHPPEQNSSHLEGVEEIFLSHPRR